jgi:drug/metabolite transporter (DMT)-like permease
MIAGAFCFAAMAALAHALGPRCGWVSIALVRALFMLTAAVGLARVAGARLAVWRPRSLWMRSLAGSFSLVCSFYALTRLPISDALTLANTYPLWIVALTWISLRRRPGGGDLLRVGCALAGVVLIERPHLSGDNLAAAVALLGSVSTAVAMLGLHRLRGVDTRAVVAHFAGVASVVAGAWYVSSGPGATVGAATTAYAAVPGFDAITVLLLFGVGVTGTVGQIFLTKAYAAGAPARVAVLGLTQVVFGLGFDAAVWQRALPPASLAGTALVLAPTAWLLARSGDVPEPA